MGPAGWSSPACEVAVAQDRWVVVAVQNHGKTSCGVTVWGTRTLTAAEGFLSAVLLEVSSASHSTVSLTTWIALSKPLTLLLDSLKFFMFSLY